MYLKFLSRAVGLILRFIEFFLFKLMDLYDQFLYTPLQTSLLPVVRKIPRTVVFSNKTYTVFTANIVSYSRTILVIPIAVCLKYQFHTTAFLLVILHDFLDHVDGIVAKAHRQMFGQVDDPLLGGFMDAFCDKIVNVLALWSILMVTDFREFSSTGVWLYVGACGVIIVYEFILGVVRVQDYFAAYYERLYGKSDSSRNMSKSSTAAVMEGKLKEKLESTGIACLCLAQANVCSANSVSGILGILCLLLSIRLAHASLQHKLNARSTSNEKEGGIKELQDESKSDPEKPADSAEDVKPISRAMSAFDFSDDSEKENKLFGNTDIKKDKDNLNRRRIESTSGSESTELEEDSNQSKRPRRRSFTHAKTHDDRVDRVYTVGCFDLFHQGHVRLLRRMRKLGKEVIVGVHDSRSILKLKSKVPIDSTETRMANVKRYADIVFCVAGTDPTSYLGCVANTNADLTSMYVRGDDMQDFPARQLAESIMTIKFLPYSEGVSSTKLRKEQYNASSFGPHVNADVHSMFY